MQPIVDLLAKNPLLLLFVVCAIGYPLGKVEVRGVSLGIASVLFVGLAIGALDARLKLPDIVYILGLAIFVYTLGLSTSAALFASLNRRGLKPILLVAGVLVLALVAAGFAARELKLSLGHGAGLFAGAFTNTPAMAAAVEALKESGSPAANDPIVSYSIAYPGAVVIPILLMVLARAVFRVNLKDEARTIPEFKRASRKIEAETVEVTRPDAGGLRVSEIALGEKADVVFGRIHRGEGEFIASGDAELQIGDRLTVVGDAESRAVIRERLGRTCESIQTSRSEFDYRRVFVSNLDVVGKPLMDLKLPASESTLITRVRRGDTDFVPHGDTILELGDRVRVLTRPENLQRVSAYFGDSYKALSEADLLALCIGIVLGSLLGLIPVPFPGGITVKLGFAGGPLVAALILGRLRRTGRLVWQIPYSANLTLRNFGLLLFAAGIGTKAGYEFVSTLGKPEGLTLFLASGALTLVGGVLTLLAGFAILKIPLNSLYGFYSGLQTQPILLGFASGQTRNDLPTSAYATVFPVATILKIVLVQILLGFF